MKNFTLRFQRLSGSSQSAEDSFVGSLVWVPDAACYRLHTLMRGGDILPLLEDLPEYVRAFLCVEIADGFPLIRLGIDSCSIDDHTAKIRETIPSARRAVNPKAGLEYLHIKFKLKPVSSTPLGMRFETRDDVFLTQPMEASYWAIVSHGSIIHCQTQLQAEQLARQLRLVNGELRHQHADCLEEIDYCYSTDPLESSWSLVIGGEEDSELVSLYAIDYQFIRTDPKSGYDFVALHSAQDHNNDHSDGIDYWIVPFAEWETSARAMIEQVRDLAFSHDAEEWYVRAIAEKEFDDTLDKMIEAMKADIEEENNVSSN